MSKYEVLATRYTHLTYKDPEDHTSRLVKRTRYNKGDVIEDGVLTHENAQRLLDAGAIAPVGADEEDFAPADPDDDSKNPATGTPPPVDKEVGDYDSWDYAQIKAEAEKRGVTGPDGSLKKKDLVAALTADDAA